MAARTFGVFAIGFAAGALVLTAGLWHSGAFVPKTVIAGSNQPIPCSSSQPMPAVMVTAPPESAPVTVPAASEESAAPPHHIGLPIAGINPATLPDTFNDARSGHKHEALDIMAPRGTPVMAVIEGNVVKLFTSKEGGLTVYQFDNAGLYSYYYAHLDHYANGLKEGVLLRQGDVLGYVGSTGNASPDAPHLHFAINKLNADRKWWEGTPVNPMPFLR